MLPRELKLYLSSAGHSAGGNPESADGAEQQSAGEHGGPGAERRVWSELRPCVVPGDGDHQGGVGADHPGTRQVRCAAAAAAADDDDDISGEVCSGTEVSDPDQSGPSCPRGHGSPG